MHVGGGSFHSVHIAAARIHTNVALHTEIILISLLGLAHLRIPLLLFVLGRTWSLNKRRVHYRTATHHIAALFKPTGKCMEKHLPNAMLFQQMAKLEQGSSVRHLFVDKINLHEGAQGVTIVNCIFNALIRQIEPALQKIHTQHFFYALGRTTTLSAWVIRLRIRNSLISRDKIVHSPKNFFSLCGPFAKSILDIAETGLAHVSSPCVLP